jgi:hypothetical protein
MAEQTAQQTAEHIEKITKRGFDLKARLEGRGLRRASIVLYLDEELGVELGYANELRNSVGAVVGKDRSGIIGDLDEVQDTRAAAVREFEDVVKKNPNMPKKDRDSGEAALKSILEGFDERIAELEAKRDELIAELTKTGITINMRAVPPVIHKDCHRKAKQTLGIDKKIPEDLKDEMVLAETAHLMSVMFQTITDNQTGDVNDDVTYDDATALMDLLPPSQWARLDAKIGEVQFTDAISRSIESQEDFS